MPGSIRSLRIDEKPSRKQLAWVPFVIENTSPGSITTPSANAAVASSVASQAAGHVTQSAGAADAAHEIATGEMLGQQLIENACALQ